MNMNFSFSLEQGKLYIINSNLSLSVNLPRVSLTIETKKPKASPSVCTAGFILIDF